MGLVNLTPAIASISSCYWANSGASLEQNIGIIVASIPALRQLFTMLKKQRYAQHSCSSGKPFVGGKPFIASPLSPSIEDMQSDQAPSPNSLVGNVTEKTEMRREVDRGTISSPTVSTASYLRCKRVSAESQCCVKDDQSTNGRECNKKRKERCESGPTLGNLTQLGYSCEIHGGSPKLTT